MASTAGTRYFSITVDDGGLAKAIDFVAERGLVRYARKGISNHVKMVQSMARGVAPFLPGSISKRTMNVAGMPAGRVGIKDYRLRFYAGGTDQRHTRRGFNRGFIVADDFFGHVAAATDPLVDRAIEQAIEEGLREAGIA